MDEKMEVLCRIHNDDEKEKWKARVMRLWQECFGDPFEYEQFYFRWVYPQNEVYLLEYNNRLKGMLHRNDYLCSVNGCTLPLAYIVGVATHRSYRRQGIMRRLLTACIRDLFEEKSPFAYLMPADVDYYEPFDFVSVSCEQKQRISVGTTEEEGKPYMIYRSYREKDRWQDDRWSQLSDQIEEVLEKQDCVFAVHDTVYWEQLFAEKQSENGDVIFCFEQEGKTDRFLGFFAYGREECGYVVEQSVFRDAGMEKLCMASFFQGKEANLPVTWVRQYPYMIRIICVERFLALFADCFFDYAQKETCIRVEDPILKDNQGIYTFLMKNGKVCVQKTEEKHSPAMETMHVNELAEFVFLKKGKTVFFAEIV